MACKTALRPGLAWAGGLAGWPASFVPICNPQSHNCGVGTLRQCLLLPSPTGTCTAPACVRPASCILYPTFCTLVLLDALHSQSCITALVAAKQADVCG
jgi:hypothetical protein